MNSRRTKRNGLLYLWILGGTVAWVIAHTTSRVSDAIATHGAVLQSRESVTAAMLQWNYAEYDDLACLLPHVLRRRQCAY